MSMDLIPGSAFISCCYPEGLSEDRRTEMPFPKTMREDGREVSSIQYCPVTKIANRLDLSV